jgi:peptidyl-dipeptidase A
LQQAQSWVNLYDRIKPFKNASLVDVTAKMEQESYTAKKMFEMSDEFYMSMGLPSSSMSYSAKAVIEKPEKVIACHASAWDFCDGKDFRIKMCTKINMEDFTYVVPHEMGHIMYDMLYKEQPLLFRNGANPGFHEAIGDTISLSYSTPQHLQTIGLLDNYADSDADNINALFSMALERVAFLPFGLLIDKWRWDVFSGEVKEADWNKHWWSLRKKYQNVEAPSDRTEAFFDPGAKYHIPADYQYIAYFIARILQFQMHRGVCRAAGQYDPNDPEKPLHKCDIDGSEVAGQKIRDGLKLGLSKHWSVALEAMTGEKVIDGGALLEYFKPLYDFLKKENEKGSGRMIAGMGVLVISLVALVTNIF